MRAEGYQGGICEQRAARLRYRFEDDGGGVAAYRGHAQVSHEAVGGALAQLQLPRLHLYTWQSPLHYGPDLGDITWWDW